ncbi:MAG: PhaM family polyhydroxyalkanoate granule multifunctional regulatory protein [Rubrivivax sp.]
MIDPSAFSKMVPGLNFLESWMRGAGQATPGMGQWIAPTLDPAELDKRIGELKTVQFWLEQNSRLISATVQAMEVQRMTLSTLQTMNLPLAELQKAMLLPTGPAALAPAPAPKPAPTPKREEPEAASHGADSPAEAPAAKPAVDPMLWWSALTQQFGELAAKAVQDGQAGISQLAGAAPKAAAAQTTGKDDAPSRRRKAAAPAKTSAPRRR